MEIIITLDAREVIVPSGQYGDEDDMLCKGCGRQVTWGRDHSILHCLQNIREDHEKTVTDLQKQIDKLKIGDRLVRTT